MPQTVCTQHIVAVHMAVSNCLYVVQCCPSWDTVMRYTHMAQLHTHDPRSTTVVPIYTAHFIYLHCSPHVVAQGAQRTAQRWGQPLPLTVYR